MQPVSAAFDNAPFGGHPMVRLRIETNHGGTTWRMLKIPEARRLLEQLETALAKYDQQKEKR